MLNIANGPVNYPEIVDLEIEPDLEKLYGAVILHNHTKYLSHLETKTFGMVINFTHYCEKKTAQMVVGLLVKVGERPLCGIEPSPEI